MWQPRVNLEFNRRDTLPGLIAARRLKRKEKNTGQLQVHRQLPCYDFCLEAGVGKVVTRWLNTVNIFPTSSTVFIHLFLPKQLSFILRGGDRERHKDGVKVISGSVCKVRTQDTDNFDEEVKPLASAR